MKTEEDEAFEEIERRQGGGFPAKRAMAADKLHWSDCAVHNAPAYPAGPCDCGVEKGQEEDWGALAEKQLASIKRDTRASFEDAMVRATHKVMARFEAQPAQEPIAYVTGTYNGRFIVEPLNPTMVLPVGMAFYTTPPKREWVGLTDEEIHGTPWYNETHKTYQFALSLIAKLKEKNT